MIKYIETKNKEEWLGLRCNDVTSTESSALFGMSPYLTEYSLWHRKMSGETPVIEDNDRMMAGRYLEHSIAKMAAKKMDIDVSPLKKYCRDESAKMGASFDYEVVSGAHDGWLMEIKNADISRKREWRIGDDWEPPPHVEIQVQHQLELTQRPGAYVVVLFGGNDLHILQMERAPRMGMGIRRRIGRFWEDVSKEKEPAPDFRRDSEKIIDMHQKAESGILNISKYDTENQEIRTLLLRANAIKDRESSLRKEGMEIKAQLLSLIGDRYKKVVADDVILSCGMVAGAPPKKITQDMLGQNIGGRNPYRNFRISNRKDKDKD